jgi:hypothetical protein
MQLLMPPKPATPQPLLALPVAPPWPWLLPPAEGLLPLLLSGLPVSWQ